MFITSDFFINVFPIFPDFFECFLNFSSDLNFKWAVFKLILQRGNHFICWRKAIKTVFNLLVSWLLLLIGECKWLGNSDLNWVKNNRKIEWFFIFFLKFYFYFFNSSSLDLNDLSQTGKWISKYKIDQVCKNYSFDDDNIDSFFRVQGLSSHQARNPPPRNLKIYFIISTNHQMKRWTKFERVSKNSWIYSESEVAPIFRRVVLIALIKR